MFKFTRENVEYTIDRGQGTDDYLLLCTYELDGKTKWLVVRDTDDLKVPALYPDQSDLEGNVHEFMVGFVQAVNTELDKKHGKAEEQPTTIKGWVDHYVDYKLSFDGTHLHLGE